MTRPRRLGLIVPSSNVTMETELPALLRGRPELGPDDVTFHASRARLAEVTAKELAAMSAEADRCAVELSDAGVDAVAYACLIALTSQGPHAAAAAERRLGDVLSTHGCPVPVVSSAGALARGLLAGGYRRVAIITPYVPALTRTVVEFLAHYGIETVDAISRSVVRNELVARLDPFDLPDIARRLDVRRADAVVASACVQMPSLAALPAVADAVDRPVVTAATATARELLEVLRLDPAGVGATRPPSPI